MNIAIIDYESGNISIYGDNSHHIIESCFKGLARSLRQALEIDPKNKKVIPSTKGFL